MFFVTQKGTNSSVTRPGFKAVVPALWAAAVLGVGLFWGCSDDAGVPGEEVGCEWFDGYNCWKQNVEAAAACAHDSTEDGTVIAGGTTCSFSDGTVIEFAHPMDLDNMDNYEWVFDITISGVPCMSYSNPDVGPLELTTTEGTYTERMYGASLGITCPDGSQYKVPEALTILECPGALEILPGHIATWSQTEFRFSLHGRDTAGPMHLFHCVVQ